MERPGSPTLEVEDGVRPGNFVRADDELFLYGDRVWRRAGDAWLDISEGLPTGCATASGICAVSSLALRGDEVFAVNTQGLFRWREGGSFEKVADLPPTDPGRSFVGALAVRDDELHLGMAEGIWRFREGSGDWELSTPGGVAFGSFPLIVDFLADGSIVFATGSPSDDSNQLYRRGPSDEGWRRLEGDDALPSYHNVVAMAAGGDGTLLFGTHRLDVGEGGRGLLYLVQSGSERYEPVSLDGLPAWNPSDAPTSVNLVDVGWLDDGSAVVAIDAHGLFRLAPGATEWERLGPEVPVGGLLIHEDGRIRVTSENRVLALSSDKSSWDLAFDAGAAILQMEVDEDGALWLATQAGVLREEDGALVRTQP